MVTIKNVYVRLNCCKRSANIVLFVRFKSSILYDTKTPSKNDTIFKLSREKSVRRLRKARRFWIKPGRTNAWWFSFCNETLPEEWKANFRMPKQTFDVLCREVGPYISRKRTRLRTPVPVEKQIVITLFYLSDGGRMKKTANAFGVAPCTVSMIVKRVTQAISTHLAGTYVTVPSTEAEIKESAANFFARYGFPQCIGAVDGTHISIRKPKENPTSFINRKGYHSPNVQACVDYNYCCFDVVIKWPGSVHDARVFGNSGINTNTIVDGEQAVPICILGDPTYLLLPYLMKEFAKGGSTPQEQFVGYRLSSARMVVECAFGRLKARFGILQWPLDLDSDNIITTIHACFILHNFCEMHNETVRDELTTLLGQFKHMA